MLAFFREQESKWLESKRSKYLMNYQYCCSFIAHKNFNLNIRVGIQKKSSYLLLTEGNNVWLTAMDKSLVSVCGFNTVASYSSASRLQYPTRAQQFSPDWLSSGNMSSKNGCQKYSVVKLMENCLFDQLTMLIVNEVKVSGFKNVKPTKAQVTSCLQSINAVGKG